MKPAIATRFRCSSPLTDLTQLTLMFLTLILQYLNKLVEGKVRDFTSPQAFHTVKVQGFNGNRIKLLAEFRRELPMKVFALVGNFPTQPCEVSHTPPPTVRTFLFTRKFFVERPKFVQGVFQRLGVLFFLTRAQCQVRVFHTEVCPNAFTCCRKPRFEICIGCCDTKPIVPAIVALDCDTTDSPMPLAVLMKRIRNFIKLPLTRMRIPFAEGQRDTIVFQRPTRFTWVGDRFELVSLFDFRSATEFLEKSVIRCVNPSQLLLNGLAWQSIPMWVCRSLQIRQVRAHCRVVRIRQAVLIALTLPFMKILVNLPHIVKQVANAYRVRLFPKRVFIGFHGLSNTKSLTPLKWVGRHVTLRLRFNCLPT